MRLASWGQYVTGTVEQRRVIGAQAGEERQVLAARDDVDAVDLDDADPVDDPMDLPHGGLAGRWSWVGKPLGHDGDASGLGPSQPGGHKAHASSLWAAWSAADSWARSRCGTTTEGAE